MNRTAHLILLLALTAGLFAPGCSEFDQPETLEPLPFFCQTDGAIDGTWFSDSVHITFDFLEQDCTVVNTRPGLVYQLMVTCNDSVRFARLEHTNFAGLTTQVVGSQNFVFAQQTLYFLEFQDQLADTAMANLKLRTTSSNDSTLLGTYTLDNTPDGPVRYDVFLSRP
ncbi:MAG: hypothetical protein AAGB22_02475 [Bacteroidota bacterium]